MWTCKSLLRFTPTNTSGEQKFLWHNQAQCFKGGHIRRLYAATAGTSSHPCCSLRFLWHFPRKHINTNTASVTGIVLQSASYSFHETSIFNVFHLTPRTKDFVKKSGSDEDGNAPGWMLSEQNRWCNWVDYTRLYGSKFRAKYVGKHEAKEECGVSGSLAKT